MATTRVSDVVVPEVFGPYMEIDTKTKTDMFTSEAVIANAFIAEKIGGGGDQFKIPYWGDLADDAFGVGSDDPAVKLALGKIGTFQMNVRRVVGSKGWSAMDLSGLLAGAKPMERIQRRVSKYWERQFQAWMNAILTGIRLDNIANDNGDMVLDLAIPAGTSTATQPTSVNLISAERIVDAQTMMGDARDDLVVMIAHSKIVGALEKQNLVKTHTGDNQASDTTVRIKGRKYYGNLLVIEDDNTTVEVTPADANGPARYRYVTTLLGRGAFTFDENPASLIAAEIDRDTLAGNGTGEEWLVTRRNFAFHPAGFSWTEASVAGLFPTRAEVMTAANWNRVFPERKQVPMQFLITNG